MSSQASNGSLFSIAANQQPFRLLELPPELLELLTSHNPPNLHFKSSDSNTPLNTSEAVLCTPTTTFHIRQQQTSNGVHLILPTLLPPPPPPTSISTTTPSIPEPALTAISQCDSSLELSPLPRLSAAELLTSTLPIYLDSSDTLRPLPRYHTRTSLFSHTPMSEAECANTWTHLTAFELPATTTLPRRAWRPSAVVESAAWKKILQICLAEAVDLTASLRTSGVLAVLETAVEEDEEGELPFALLEAILLRLCHRGTTASSTTTTTMAVGVVAASGIDKTITLTHTALLILKAQAETHSESPYLDVEVFRTQWRDSLPEVWRSDAVLAVLPTESYVLVAGQIRFRVESEGAVVDGGGGDDGVQGKGKGNTGKEKGKGEGKRRWHEKFAKARKQGRFGE